ncbi:MAG TPA: aldo/keto reductase, partial [Candidatus Polarisedimenticolia bacterium]|nr:aldo/keto reductase [Candidatus Polarisedimenticolia bacterium]
MRYKLLGRSGLRVSELCLGTMTFGEEWGWGASRDESRKIFDAFVEEGGNFLDTANKYTEGTSEKLVGEFIRGNRERFVVATKYTSSMRPGDPNGGGNHRKSMVESLEGSLKRLGTDYVDLYWLHAWDSMTPVEEVMRAFDDMVRAGKILYAGISDAPAWIVSQANTLAALRGWTPFIGLQVEYSLAERTPERDLLPMARALDIGVTAWSPLAGGLLTGKYNKDAPKAGSSEAPRFEVASGFSKITDRNLKIAEAVRRIAQDLG